MGKPPSVPLQELCQVIQYGYTASATQETVGPKFLRITDIAPDTIKWEEVPYCKIEKGKEEKYILKSGDIVIARTGATTGYAKYLKNPPPSVFASYLIRIQVKKGIDARFVGLVVQSDIYKRFIQTQMGGSAQPNANAKVLTSFPVLLPPLPVQNKIASFLSAYDDLIENNLRRIKSLEEMAQLLYREWFVKFRFPGHEKVRMVDSPLGKIPEGWKAVTLGDLAHEERRAVSPDEIDPETPYIGLEHMPRRSIALSEWGEAREVQSTKLLFKAGEILFGKIRPYFHKVGVALVDGACSSDAIVIIAESPETFPLVLGCVSSVEFIAHASQTSQGTKMPRANWQLLTNFPIAMPPRPLLVAFNKTIRDAVSLIANLVLRNRNLRRSRDLLLPNLISGELDVSDLDIKVREDIG